MVEVQEVHPRYELLEQEERVQLGDAQVRARHLGDLLRHVLQGGVRGIGQWGTSSFWAKTTQEVGLEAAMLRRRRNYSRCKADSRRRGDPLRHVLQPKWSAGAGTGHRGGMQSTACAEVH